MGITLGFLLETDLGTDPYTYMNVNVAGAIGTTLGNWQFALNLVMFIIVILITGIRQIGPGSIANMILVGKLLKVFGEYDEELVKKALAKCISARHADLLNLNLKCMEIGRDSCAQ